MERSLPKSEFRKKVAIFSLVNVTGDTAYHWMMYAIPEMIKVDLILFRAHTLKVLKQKIAAC
jgi:hypothetical protein